MNAGRADPGRLLVIGLGNPDRGDDGVGALVVHALRGRLPDGVGTMIRTGDMLALGDDWTGADAVICIDAAAPVAAPGRIHRIDGLAGGLLPEPGLASSHAFGLAEAIALARVLGTAPATLVVYAVEGANFDGGAPISAAVAGAAEEVVQRVLADVALLLQPVGSPVAVRR